MSLDNGIRFFILAEIKDLLAMLDREEITTSKFTEALNKKANRKLLFSKKDVMIDSLANIIQIKISNEQ